MCIYLKNYFRTIIKVLKNSLTNYSFGAVAAIITNLALIFGFNNNTNSKYNIIGSLLVIALADNISDSLGIHIHQEAEGPNVRGVWYSTIINFSTRLCTSLVFITIVIFTDNHLAKILSMVYGLTILTVISYIIAQKRHLKPQNLIIEHIAVAIFVMFISKSLNNWISVHFLK